jgi:CBS-domain-containing membrane protein
MGLVGRAKRLRIYVNEGDMVGHVPAPIAVLSLLRKEDAAGATVFHAKEGFGASGVVHTTNLADLIEKLPIVIEWVDLPQRIERLLPQLKEMVPFGLMTLEETEVIYYRPRAVRDVSAGLTAADVMARNVVTFSPDTKVREIVERMMGQIYRAVPVVEDGRPIGIITNSDLTERGTLGVRLTLLNALDPSGKRDQLDRVGNGGKVARDVMTPNPVTIPAKTPLPEVASLMTSRHLKRLPVVDESGALVGMISRLDLLRTVVQGFQTGDASPRRPSGLSGTTPVSAIMRSDVPTVHVDTRLPEVFQAVVATRLHRALVVDSDRHVLGVISDAELLQRVTPTLHPSAIRSLMQRLAFVQPTVDDQHASARQAGDLMTNKLATVPPDAPLHQVSDLVVSGGHKLVVVIDKDGRLLGAVDRADLLRGLSPPGAPVEQNGSART